VARAVTLAMTRVLLLVVTGLSTASQLPAQGSTRAAFDVASIKPHPNPERQDFRFPQFLPGGRFQATTTVFQVISSAYRLPINASARVSVGPGAMGELQAVYDIDATGVIPPGFPGNARAERQRLMLQALLEDRFKLVVRRETKEMPVYALLVAKGGPKLPKADIAEKDCPDQSSDPFNAATACHAFNGGQGRGLHGRAVDMSDLVQYVENWTYRPLIDKTGIKGLYRIETSGWTPLQAGPPPPAGTKAEDGRDFADVPTLFQVFAGLGLKIEPQKAPVEVLTIERLEKPSAN
jgi:uncharacterized protein (TIGR03435 family)